MKTVDVTTSIEINAPRDEVASFASNPDNAPAWYSNIKSVEWKGDPSIRIGARIAFVAQFLGRRLSYTYEIVDLLAKERFVMRTADGPFPMETVYTWESTGPGKTRMTLRNSGTPSGFSKWVAPFISAAMRRANQKDLARLKALLEAG